MKKVWPETTGQTLQCPKGRPGSREQPAVRADRKTGVTDLTRLQPLAGIFASIFLLVYGATTLYLVAQIDEEISANLAGGIGASQYPWLVSVALVAGAGMLLFVSIRDLRRAKGEVANAAGPRFSLQDHPVSVWRFRFLFHYLPGSRLRPLDLSFRSAGPVYRGTTQRGRDPSLQRLPHPRNLLADTTAVQYPTFHSAGYSNPSSGIDLGNPGPFS